MQDPETVKLWYIAGWKRSGTTLLCEMLGGLDGAIALGELSGVWIALDKDRACSCGATSLTCPLWTRVVDELMKTYPDIDYAEMAELGKRVLRTRRVLELFRYQRMSSEKLNSDIDRYSRVMEELFLCIARVSGCSILVDSSKLPPLAALAKRMPSVDLELFHIVRDPRAVANSERKSLEKAKDEPIWSPPGQRLSSSAVYWAGSNLTVWLTGRVVGSYHPVSYEKLSSSPEGWIDRTAYNFGIQRGDTLLDSGHIVTGNPARMGGAGRMIARDDRWKSELGFTDQLLVLLITWPLLLLFK